MVLRFLLMPALLLIALAGCGVSSGTISSTTSSVPHGEIRKMWVEADVKKVFSSQISDELSVFTPLMTDSLKKCGVDNVVHIFDPLSIGDAEKEHFRDFGPEYLLDIRWTRSISTEYRHVNSVTVYFDLWLTKTQTKEAIWKANIKLDRRWYSASTLVNLIIQKMKDDGLLGANCVAPDAKAHP